MFHNLSILVLKISILFLIVSSLSSARCETAARPISLEIKVSFLTSKKMIISTGQT